MMDINDINDIDPNTKSNESFLIGLDTGLTLAMLYSVLSNRIADWKMFKNLLSNEHAPAVKAINQDLLTIIEDIKKFNTGMEAGDSDDIKQKIAKKYDVPVEQIQFGINKKYLETNQHKLGKEILTKTYHHFFKSNSSLILKGNTTKFPFKTLFLDNVFTIKANNRNVFKDPVKASTLVDYLDHILSSSRLKGKYKVIATKKILQGGVYNVTLMSNTDYFNLFNCMNNLSSGINGPNAGSGAIIDNNK